MCVCVYVWGSLPGLPFDTKGIPSDRTHREKEKISTGSSDGQGNHVYVKSSSHHESNWYILCVNGYHTWQQNHYILLIQAKPLEPIARSVLLSGLSQSCRKSHSCSQKLWSWFLEKSILAKCISVQLLLEILKLIVMQLSCLRQPSLQATGDAPCSWLPRCPGSF